jgi:hypothetical protein
VPARHFIAASWRRYTQQLAPLAGALSPEVERELLETVADQLFEDEGLDDANERARARVGLRGPVRLSVSGAPAETWLVRGIEG